jgi:flagellar assembly protein FliH
MLCKRLDSDAEAIQPVAWGSSGAAGPGRKAGKADLDSLIEAKGRQSFQEGYRAGEEAARRAGQAEVQGVVKQLAETIAAVAGTRADTIRRAEVDTVKLAIEIARRVVHRELTVDGSALESLIRAALEKLQAQEIHRVRIHPDQERTLKACLEESGRGQSVSVVSDPLQARGGAVFEISRGSLDASVETQLAEIERGLIDQLELRA